MGRNGAIGALILAASMIGCAQASQGPRLTNAEIRADPRWVGLVDVPLVRQQDLTDCGAAVLTMVLRYWGRDASLDAVAQVFASPDGAVVPIRAGDLRNFARASGLHAYLLSAELGDLKQQLAKRRPIIVGLQREAGGVRSNHYEIVVGYHPKKRVVVTLDPAVGWRGNLLEDFLRDWQGSDRLALITFPDEAARPGPPPPGLALPATREARRPATEQAPRL